MNNFKKYIVIIFTFLIYLNAPISFSANNQINAEIAKIENNLYGFEYINDELKSRVSRLEISIYGKVKSGDINTRIKNLASDMLAEQIGSEITPREDTFSEDSESADSTVNYPIVDEIEMKLFNRTYKERDFHTRIVAIERKLFGKIYDVDDYSTRMDRIKTEIMPDALLTDSNRFRYNENALNSNDLSGIDQSRYGFNMPFGQRKYTRPYANYGDYNSMPENIDIEEELAKLEYDTFGTEFSGEDPKTRVKRLKSAKNAKKTSHRYDSQKFQQRISTAMEIGAMILMILAMVL